MKILDSFTEFDENADGLLIKRQQEIPSEFLADLTRLKIENQERREGEFMLAASIPVIVVEELLKKGWDVYREPVRETLKKLRELGLDGFITTSKRV